MLTREQVEDFTARALELAAPIIRRHRRVVDGPDYEGEVDERLTRIVPIWDVDRDIPFDKYVSVHICYACAQARRADHLLGATAVRWAKGHEEYTLPVRHSIGGEGDPVHAKFAVMDATPQFEEDEAFNRVIMGLGESHRQFATLLYHDDLDWGEIAATMHRTRHSLYSLHQRVRHNLRGR